MGKSKFLKKKLIVLVSAFAITGTVSAQYSNFNSNSRFSDNLSLGLDFGVQSNLHDWNTPYGGVIGLNLNKELSPYFGLSLEALLGINNTPNWYYNEGYIEDGNGINTLSGLLSGRWNVTNTVCGFKGYRRVFELETNIGAGYGRFFSQRVDEGNWNAFRFKTGLNFNFYLGQARSFGISIKPAVMWNLSETGQFDIRYAVAQLMIGLSYHFKTSNSTHYFVKGDTSTLQDELAALQVLNAELQAQMANPPIVEKEVIVEKIVDVVDNQEQKFVESTFVVNFAFNSAQLTGMGKSSLDKVPTDATVNIAGYASPEGNRGYNLKLSDRRAAAVAKYLEGRGVKVNKVVGYGAENAESNRLVIVNIL